MKVAFLCIILAVGTIVALIAWPAWPAPGEHSIELIDPGTSPKLPLRIIPEAGKIQRAELTVTSSISMNIGGESTASMPMPSLTFVMEVTPSTVEPNGDISFDFSFPKASGSMGNGQDMIAGDIGLAGLAGYGVMTDRGVSKDIGFLDSTIDAKAKQIADNMRDSLVHLAVPLPVEPVGVGAEWKSSQGIEKDGIHLVQISTYKITSRTDSTLTLDVTIHQTAPAQDLTEGIPNLPSNAGARLTSLDLEGSGTLTIDLTRVLPVRGSLSISGDTTIEFSVGDEEREMKMGMEMSVTVAAR